MRLLEISMRRFKVMELLLPSGMSFCFIVGLYILLLRSITLMGTVFHPFLFMLLVVLFSLTCDPSLS